MQITISDRLVMLLSKYIEHVGPRGHNILATQIASVLASEFIAQQPQELPSPVPNVHTFPPPNVVPRIWNKNRSKYGGSCGECFEPIEPGEIVYLTEGTRARHLRCAPQPPDIIR